jgi:uracil-DNA glycosylase
MLNPYFGVIIFKKRMVMDKKWLNIIKAESSKDYFVKLDNFITKERRTKLILPPSSLVYSAFELTDFDNVKVIIIGQDPYHQKGVANGLSFSVNLEDKLPKSLINIFKELKSDLDIENTNGDLRSWAKQGVFLLNTILTVEEGRALSHKNLGWEKFSKTIIEELNKDSKPKVFLLWGNQAKKFEQLITNKNHLVITSAHPSPLSAYNGFLGSKPFSKINEFLAKNSISKINWNT